MGRPAHPDRLMLIALLLAAVSADPAPDPAKYPLPQDRKLAAARLAGRTDWLRAQWVGDFDRTADKLLAGHAEARKAVGLAADVDARHGLRVAVASDARNAAIRAAVKAGSEHPLVFLLQSRHLPQPGQGRAAWVADRPAADKWSPVVRSVAGWEAAREADAFGQPDERDKHLGKCAAALAELAADPHPQAKACATRQVVAFFEDSKLGLGPADRLAAFAPALAGPKVPARVRDLAAGLAAKRTGSEARGTGFADTVSDDQLKRFRAAFTEAEPRLTAAWTADPTDPLPAVEMVGVCMGLNRPRDEMETWFRRALTADPDNYQACVAKLLYLLPQWHGSAAEAVAFGRQCLAVAHPDNRLADVLYDAHRNLNRAGKGAYWRQPTVWSEVRAMLEPVVTAHPTDRQARTRFAKLAHYAGYPELADAQLRAIKDRVWAAEFADAVAAGNFRTDVDNALAAKRAREAARP